MKINFVLSKILNFLLLFICLVWDKKDTIFSLTFLCQKYKKNCSKSSLNSFTKFLTWIQFIYSYGQIISIDRSQLTIFILHTSLCVKGLIWFIDKILWVCAGISYCWSQDWKLINILENKWTKLCSENTTWIHQLARLNIVMIHVEIKQFAWYHYFVIEPSSDTSSVFKLCRIIFQTHSSPGAVIRLAFV